MEKHGKKLLEDCTKSSWLSKILSAEVQRKPKQWK